MSLFIMNLYYMCVSVCLILIVCVIFFLLCYLCKLWFMWMCIMYYKLLSVKIHFIPFSFIPFFSWDGNKTCWLEILISIGFKFYIKWNSTNMYVHFGAMEVSSMHSFFIFASFFFFFFLMFIFFVVTVGSLSTCGF